MLTFADYKVVRAFTCSDWMKNVVSEIETDVANCEEDSSDIGGFSFQNVSHFRLRGVANLLLHSTVLDERYGISSTARIIRWMIDEEGIVSLIQESFYRIHGVGSFFEVSSEEIIDFQNQGMYIHLETTNQVVEDDLSVKGEDVIDKIRDVMIFSARYLDRKDLSSIEWRYEQIQSCPDMGWVVAMLLDKGFAVDLQEPYVVVDKIGVSSKQSIAVRIREESSVREDGEWETSSLYKPGFSLHNLLISSRDFDKKTPLSSIREIQATKNLKNTLEEIGKELTLLAETDPLIRRYAFDISHLHEDHHQALLAALGELGYRVSLDSPFISSECQKNLYEEGNNHFKQYIFINLE